MIRDKSSIEDRERTSFEYKRRSLAEACSKLQRNSNEAVRRSKQLEFQNAVLETAIKTSTRDWGSESVVILMHIPKANNLSSYDGISHIKKRIESILYEFLPARPESFKISEFAWDSHTPTDEIPLVESRFHDLVMLKLSVTSMQSSVESKFFTDDFKNRFLQSIKVRNSSLHQAFRNNRMRLIGCFLQVNGLDYGFKFSSILERIAISHDLGLAIFLTESGSYSVSYIREDSVAGSYGSIQVSDTVVAIDGVSLRGKHVDAVKKMMQGKPETPLTLEIRRAGQEEGEKTDSIVLLRPSPEKSEDSELRSILQQESCSWSISQVQEWTGVM
uniref:PDZ domain-containing protein n=1 Tax=Guillardia theta TaxID=55529 RepID=A0A7S4JC23_GUITH